MSAQQSIVLDVATLRYVIGCLELQARQCSTSKRSPVAAKLRSMADDWRRLISDCAPADTHPLMGNPPRHKFWGAGEADCPREIKAGNGELHTLRCKVCDQDDPRDSFCRAAIAMEARRGETPKSGSTAEGGDSAGRKASPALSPIQSPPLSQGDE